MEDFVEDILQQCSRTSAGTPQAAHLARADSLPKGTKKKEKKSRGSDSKESGDENPRRCNYCQCLGHTERKCYYKHPSKRPEGWVGKAAFPPRQFRNTKQHRSMDY